VSSTPPPEPSRSIARREFEEVIRRAAELSLQDSDAEDRLTEDEVLRIATELGLSSRHVKQALYELPPMDAEASVLQREFGSPIVTSARAVPGDADDTLRRLEDYLTTREYLQLVRRRHGRAFLAPADDTISNLARGLLRPSRRYLLARSRRVVLSARPLDDATTHVQIATDMSEHRSTAVRNAIMAGGFGGLVLGGVGAVVVAATSGMPQAATTIAEIAAFGGGMTASMFGAIKLTGARFRARMAAARTELEALLDRAERGERLEPPPAPWRKRLQQRFLGPDGR
jgi:hypothetical protein